MMEILKHLQKIDTTLTNQMNLFLDINNNKYIVSLISLPSLPTLIILRQISDVISLRLLVSLKKKKIQTPQHHFQT